SVTMAARTVAAMDENLVVAGFSRLVRVFDLATFARAVSTDDEPMGREAMPLGGSEYEVGGYLVRANSTEAWDAIVALLHALDAVVEMFAEAGMVPQRPRALLEGTDARQPRLARIRTLMEYVRENDDTAYHTRSRELAFLANALVAGCSIQSRSFTPQEASDAA